MWPLTKIIASNLDPELGGGEREGIVILCFVFGQVVSQLDQIQVGV